MTSKCQHRQRHFLWGRTSFKWICQPARQSHFFASLLNAWLWRYGFITRIFHRDSSKWLLTRILMRTIFKRITTIIWELVSGTPVHMNGFKIRSYEQIRSYERIFLLVVEQKSVHMNGIWPKNAFLEKCTNNPFICTDKNPIPHLL